MKEKETSKVNITRRRQEIREELSVPPRRFVDEIHLSGGRQTIDLDDDEEEPLVRVSKVVDGERRYEMGYLYEAIDRAKELIQMNNKMAYAKWWEIIDRRWEHTLHHDLHATGHFFNLNTCIGLMGGMRTMTMPPKR
ncbi:hypothetical protein Taro_026120 [Colocasia esculenta]|uniref:Uncharacterized protein n=1 Tax=Colocasia esculenta TaxID=4460 RepID=A0A843VC15_COLES|nr:hypothetical protein [Colocasia esculenta]